MSSPMTRFAERTPVIWLCGAGLDRDPVDTVGICERDVPVCSHEA